jgi:RNA polymerase sigma factor (sigma-70 family)
LDNERLFLEHVGLLEQVVRFIARRHRLSPDEAEELSAGVRLKFIERDYEVLRRFQGRSSLRTYVTAVAQRYFLDQRIARWGKWRPSAEARRLGPAAVSLDRLLSRDGLSFDEACEVLRAEHRIALTREELAAMREQLPQRTTRRMVGEEPLAQVASAGESPEAMLETRRQMSAVSRIEQALSAALEGLAPQDRLILRMRFREGCQIAEIARLLVIEQKPLYRRLQHVLTVLRRELESRQVSREDVLAILGQPAVEFDSIMEANVSPPSPVPSRHVQEPAGSGVSQAG